MRRVKHIFLAVVIATCASAQAKAQDASPLVRRMADWVIASSDNGALPFAIVDKKAAEVFVFDREGHALGGAPALLGLGVGDDSVPGVGDKPLSAIKPKDRTTPAGRFVTFQGHQPGHASFLWLDYKNAIAMHRVVKGIPKDRRAERLASPTPLDNRITFGCINLPVAFYEQTLLPAFKGAKGVVYVLPEVRAMADVFPKYREAGG